MGFAKLMSVFMLIGLCSSALIYQSESNPEERYVFEDEGDSLAVPAAETSSEEMAREPEYYVPSDQVREQFEKDDQEIMDRIAQIFNEEFRYERAPEFEVEESQSRKRRSPQYVQLNNNNFDQYFSNRDQSKIPDGQLNQGDTNQGGIIRGSYRPVPQTPLVIPTPRPVQPQNPVVILPVVPLPGRVPADPSLRCPPGSHGAYFPVQGDCRSFIHCDRGQPFRKQCGPGTFWNQNLLTCTHGPCNQNLVVVPPYGNLAGGRDQRPSPDPSKDIWQQRPVPGRLNFGSSYGNE